MRIIIIALIAVLAVSAPAAASIMLQPSEHGIALFNDSTRDKKVLSVVIDKTELLNSYGYWKEIHALRAEATETMLRTYAYNFASIFALNGVIELVHGEAPAFDGNPTKILAEIVEPDEFGNQIRHPMFSFTYTKSMAAKINWDNFDAISFQKIAPDFHYSTWYQRKLDQEG